MKIFRQIFSPIQVNTYILSGNDNECIIIDCGCYDRNEEKQLEDFLDQSELIPKMLLNTHCHLDHVFGNGFMLNRYGLKSRAHADDYKVYEDSPKHAAIFGLKMADPPELMDFLKDGDKDSLNEMAFKVLWVPGHTPGSIAFYFPENGVVFTGDALFAGSIGRTDLPGGDHDALVCSITEKLFTLPDETIVYPGHGPETTIGHEKITNPFFR